MEAYGREGSPRDDGASPVPVSAALRHKYRPGVWRYNARMACVLVPSMLLLVFSGGNAVVGTALTGTALVYVFDLLGSAEAALAAVWVTAFALYVATMANGDVFASHRSAATSCLLLLAHLQLLFTAAAWATLQFRWVQSSFPGVTLATERFLFLVAPVIAGQALGGWGAAAVLGARAAPWAQLATQTACFAAFSFPAPSSFRTERKRKQLREGKGSTSGQISGPERATKGPKGRAMDDRLMILRDVDARTHAALFCAAPFASYAATHKNTLFSFVAFSRASSFSSSALLFEHVCSCALLLAFPPALMCLAASRGGLRWAFAEPGGRAAASLKTRTAAERSAEAARACAAARGVRDRTARARESPPTRDETCGARDASLTRRRATIVASTASLAVFAFGALGRVAASGFREYVVLPSPYGYLAVAAAVYGTMLAGAAFLTGAVPLPVAAATLCVSAVAAAAAIGVPGWLWPAAAASAWGLTRFVADDGASGTHGASAKATDYALFVCGAAACAARFLEDNFGNLDVELDEMPIRDLTRFLLLNVSLCLVAPGAALASFAATRTEKKISPRAFGAALGLHALMFARCEDALHSAMHEDGTSMYPPYLVATTTVLGLVAADALRARGVVTEITAWFCSCVYAAKLFVLFVPGEDALVPCVLVALAFTSAEISGRGGGREHEPDTYADARRVAAEDFGRVFLILGACVHARFVAFDAAFALTGRRPTDATVFGGLLLCASCGVTPLVVKRYAHNAAAKRALAVAFASGAALATLKPPMPWKGEADGFWYDAAHVPDFEPDDADVYGDRALGTAASRNGWPTWALACAALAAAYCATSKGAGDVVGGAGWAPLGALIRRTGVAERLRRDASTSFRVRVDSVTSGAGRTNGRRFPGFSSTRRGAVAFALAAVAFLETATLRSGVALAGGHAFGAYLGAETFPGAGRGLTGPLRVACAACAWLLAHVASPETNARAAGPAAWLAFGVGAAGVLAAGWSQRDPGRPAFGVDERDERLRREEARLGVLGAAVGLAAMVAFALKTAAGGGGATEASRGCAGRARDGGVAGGTTPTTTTTTTTTTNPPPPAPSRRRTTRRRGAVCGAGGGPRRLHERRAQSTARTRKTRIQRAISVRAVQRSPPRAPAWKRVRAPSARAASRARGMDARAGKRRRRLCVFGGFRALRASRRRPGHRDVRRRARASDAARRRRVVHFPARRAAVRAPLAAAATQLLGAALSDARTFGFGAPESELRAAAAAAWGAGEERSVVARWRTFLTEAFLALAAAPCAWRLTEYLWSPARRARAAESAVLAPLNVLALAAARSRAARTLAVTSLACVAAQHAAQRHAKRAGMRAL